VVVQGLGDVGRIDGEPLQHVVGTAVGGPGDGDVVRLDDVVAHVDPLALTGRVPLPVDHWDLRPGEVGRRERGAAVDRVVDGEVGQAQARVRDGRDRGAGRRVLGDGDVAVATADAEVGRRVEGEAAGVGRGRPQLAADRRGARRRDVDAPVLVDPNARLR